MSAFTHPADGAAASPRVIELKRRIDYDAAVAGERSDEFVDLDLTRLAVPTALAKWEADRQVDVISDSETLLDLRLKHDQQVVTMRVSLFSAATPRHRVAERLIARADAVTTVHISDVRGPRDLGTLSLTPGSGGTVYWVYRNVYAEVIVFQSPVDKLAVARDMQAQFEAALRRR